MTRLASVMAAILALGACAKSAEEVEPQFVSGATYRMMECAALKEELVAIQARVSVLSGKQDEAATRDGVAVAVGLIVFWPALFVLAADDSADELGRLKGAYEAILRTGEEQDCAFATDIRTAEAAAATARRAAATTRTPTTGTAERTDLIVSAAPSDEPSWEPTRRESRTGLSPIYDTPVVRDGAPVDPGQVSVSGQGSGVAENAALPTQPIEDMDWEERRQIAAYNRANRYGATMSTE